MIAVTDEMPESEYIVRVDGLHFWFDTYLTAAMLTYARDKSLDLVKLPDDFPAQLSSEIIKVAALRKVGQLLENESTDTSSRFHIHPKFYIQNKNTYFKSAIFEDIPNYSDEFLKECRKKALSIYIDPRIDIGEKSVPAGDSISFHYEFAKSYIKSSDRVLDIASGLGFGASMIADKAGEIVCADIDSNAIALGAEKFSKIKNMQFSQQDVTAMTFPDNSFDIALSFETVEHVDEIRFFDEIHRVLKPGGMALISTPQNRLGRIPITSEHVREFSLKEISDLASRKFILENLVGIKAGTIWFENDPCGSNTIIVARKPASVNY
jgi:2-polyprenyl-3-methyl-5-hydroxy-6-metoxy-1,4-benzoquinol methylase